MESQDVVNSELVKQDNHILNNDQLAEVIWTVLSISTAFVIFIFIVTCIRVLVIGQKTRNPQQRRMYVNSRPRQSLPAQEPTIYVSPSNLPPPPKYECMAPPSYEEVVGVHYPQYQIQPISQPINAALAQGPSSPQPGNNTTSVVTTVNETTPTVPAERRASNTVTRP